MMHRNDSKEFIDATPVGVINGGSGNGLAKTITEQSGEFYSPENLAYIITTGATKYMDLMEIEFSSKEQKVYAFHGLMWGIIADCDLDSEV